MSQRTRIFLSYSWKNNKEADAFFSDFSELGLEVIRDKGSIKYKDNLREFMQKIRESNFAVILISEDYLKSINCLYEFIELSKEVDFSKKALPILVGKQDIFSLDAKMNYIKYWQDLKEEKKLKIKELDSVNAIAILQEIKLIETISSKIDELLDFITSNKILTLDEHKKEGYKSLFERLDHLDVTYLIDLLFIYQVEDVEKQEILLDAHLETFGSSQYYYNAKASIAKKHEQFERAKLFYQKAILKDKENTTSLNNLGMLYQHIYKDYKNAKECFQKAIKVDPKHTVARLNLGVLLSEHFKNSKGAKRQYEAILEYEEEPKAHNNLANLYRPPSKDEDLEKVEFHLKKAIELDPNYVDAHMNYGNFLKLEKKDFINGNKHYEIAKKMMNDPEWDKAFDLLIKSKKV